MNTVWRHKRSCLSTWLVSWSWWTVRLDLRVLSFSLISNISNITSFSIDRVGHLLESSVRKWNIITSRCSVTISRLISTKVVVCVVIFHCIGVSVLGRFIWVRRSCSCGIGRCRSIRTSEDGRGEKDEGEEGLNDRKKLLWWINGEITELTCQN